MEKKQEIIEAGLYLLKTGLIARTWGNISARINDEEFYITPSGKAYTDITFDNIPSVKISDCSYDKHGAKPSSEKLVHASAYKVRKDINYVVHTHQLYASAICAEEKDVTLSDGTKIYCANYALSSTKKLAKEVLKTKIDIKLDPMTSFERRIVHNVVNNFEHLATESEGETPNRYVVIKYKED